MTSTLLILCCIAFLAGFIDAIVGGGGLIQTPAGLILFPNEPIARVIGSLKIPSFTGTFFAVIQYLKKVKIPTKRLLLFTSIAFLSAFTGSYCLTLMSSAFMKPIIFLVLIVIAIYTYTKKNLGLAIQNNTIQITGFKGALICLVIGFYDGFIGPGAGSLLVLAFISICGLDFLQSNAHAKVVNLATNLGSILLFAWKGSIIWAIALPMAAFNALGGFLGSKLAIAKGNKFIRIIFLFVLIATLSKLGYDLFLH
jgi:uncharacterized membrane protein YfcA